jgi:uncharacterized protein (DUF488 family)
LPTFFTIGHSTRSADELIQILESSDIGVLVDVRAIPRSRTNLQFKIVYAASSTGSGDLFT